jgi:hypothetical protein
MSATARVYSPSGKTGNSFLFMPPLGFAAGVIMGGIYAYINVYNPLLILQGIATFLLGYGLSQVLIKGAKLSQCRSIPAAMAIGLLTAVVGIYVAWATFEYALIRKSVGEDISLLMPAYTDLLFDPALVWNTALGINEEGWFSIGKGAHVSGIFLAILWIGEILIVLGLVLFPLYAFVSNTLYCEACKVWCNESKDLARFEPAPSDALTQRLKDGDLTAIAELTPHAGTDNSPFIRIDSQRCQSCGNTATFQASQVTFTQEKDGKWNTVDKQLSGNVLYSEAELAKLTESLARPKPS